MMTCSSRLYKLLLLAICFVSIETKPTAKVTDPPAHAFHWSYDDLKGWKEHFPSCGGEHQSPINLKMAKSKLINYPDFVFNNFDKMSQETVSNNGHTVVMSFNQSGSDLPFITGGGLDGRFNFVQLHFHWGVDSMKGSEHYINNRQYSAELHMVHYNTKYPSFVEATKFQDGLAVLGILIELEARDNIAFRHLEQFQEIIHPVTGKSTFLPVPVPLSDLLPDDTTTFFRYNGSLTTPGCDQDVMWTIFDTPIAISLRQLDKFRLLKNDEGQPMAHNFRPVQELHNRLVFYSAKDTAFEEAVGSATSNTSAPNTSTPGTPTLTTSPASSTPAPSKITSSTPIPISSNSSSQAPIASNSSSPAPIASDSSSPAPVASNSSMPAPSPSTSSTTAPISSTISPLAPSPSTPTPAKSSVPSSSITSPTTSSTPAPIPSTSSKLAPKPPTPSSSTPNPPVPAGGSPTPSTNFHSKTNPKHSTPNISNHKDSVRIHSSEVHSSKGSHHKGSHKGSHHHQHKGDIRHSSAEFHSKGSKHKSSHRSD